MMRSPFRLGAIALLCCLPIAACPRSMAQPAGPRKKEAQRIDLGDPTALPTTRVLFHNPDVLPTERGPNENGGVVSVNLEVNRVKHAIDRSLDRQQKDTVWLRSYNGGIVGPVIRARPGDRLKIKLKNAIARSVPDTPQGKNLNIPGGFNITNLHTHGLHVSPEGSADNIFKEIGPGETADFCFDIPANHPAGTFWYHPHRHGSTAVQVASGMAGALIVDGGMDETPEIKEAMRSGREKILVFQQITYRIGPNQPGEVTAGDVYRPLAQRTEALPGGLLRVVNPTINGLLFPDMIMAPGEIQRWRCIHAGTNSGLNLAITDGKEKTLWLHELARDGLALPQVTPQKNILLQPGYRADFLVQAPPTPGEYFLVSGKIEASKSITKAEQALEYLARVVVRGAPVKMKLPPADAIKKYAPPPIPDAELLKERRTIHFFAKIEPGHKIMSINGKMFGQDPEPLRVRLGTAEEWRLSSEGAGGHPFHIHVNPFEVIDKNAADGIQRYWRDTIMVNADNGPANPVVIRMRFDDFPGKTVLHCHSLDHEDQGMMMAVRIDGKAPPSRCAPKRQIGLPALPAKAPAWALRDAQDKPHEFKEFADRDVVLVFFRGLACSHCRSQLEALAKRRQALMDAKLTVVAICPDTSDELRRTLRDVLPADLLPFLILSDPALEAFRAYGCHDGRALHGTFLIGAGTVRWQEVGDEPFLDVDRLLNESKRLRQKQQP